MNNNKQQKLVLKIVSVFAAVVLWLFVSHTEESLIDVNLNSIDVHFAGENYLNEQGFMVINKESVPKASVRIRGKRADIISVMGNVSASVDLSGIESKGTYKLKPSFDIPSNAVYVSKRNTLSVEVDIAEIAEKTIPVKTVVKNADRNKSYIVEAVPKYDEITIKGEKNDIELISHAAVYVDVSSMTQDNEGFYEIVFEDESGEFAAVNDVMTETGNMKVFNYVYDKKTVEVKVSIPFSISDKYSIELLNQEFEQVEVGVSNEEGRGVSSITNKEYFDSLLPGVHTYLMELEAPSGIFIPKDKRYIEIELEVFEKAEKVVSVPVSVKNSGGKSYTLESETVDVLISGPREKLNEEAVAAELDIGGISADGSEKELRVKLIPKEKDINIETKSVFANITIEE